MKATLYAEAVYRASLGKGDAECATLAERLCAMLRARGHGRLLPQISIALSHLDRSRRRAEGVTLRVASEKDADAHHEHIARDIEQLGGEGSPERTMIDATAIGGYEVRVKGKCLDRTYKRTLVGMYETFITR